MTRRTFLLTELSAGFVSACLTLPLCLGAGGLVAGLARRLRETSDELGEAEQSG